MFKYWKGCFISLLIVLQLALLSPRKAEANNETVGIVIASIFGLMVVNEIMKPHSITISPEYYPTHHPTGSWHVQREFRFQIELKPYAPGWCLQTRYIYENGVYVGRQVRDILCPSKLRENFRWYGKHTWHGRSKHRRHRHGHKHYGHKHYHKQHRR